MAYGYRRRRYGRWPYRSWRRGVSASSTAGVKQFTCIIPCTNAFGAVVNAGQFFSNTFCVSPYCSCDATGQRYLNCLCGLPSSYLYRTYCHIYDQVKINWVSVKIGLMTNIGAGGVTPAMKIHTCWDRAVVSSEILDNGLPTAATIQTGSESQSTMLVNNSKAVIRRFNRARDLQERTTFHDCSLLNFVETASNATYVMDQSWCSSLAASSIIQDKSIGYAPGLSFCLNPAVSAESNVTYNVSVEARWSVTFRNPKYGLSEGAAKAVERDLGSLDEKEDVAMLRAKIAELEAHLDEKRDVEVLDDDKDDEEESQEPLTQPIKLKKAKRVST